MICIVRLENVVMNQRVLLKWIPETLPWLMHKKPVQRPFKKRREDRPRHESNREPKEKGNHNELLSIKDQGFLVHCRPKWRRFKYGVYRIASRPEQVSLPA